MPVRVIAAVCLAVSFANGVPPPLPGRGKADEPTLPAAGEVPPPVLTIPRTLEAAEEPRRSNAAASSRFSEAKFALNDATAALRRKAASYRAGQCSKAELQASADAVRAAAAAYRLSLAKR